MMKLFCAFIAIMSIQSCISQNSAKGDQNVKAQDILEKLQKGENIYYVGKTIEGDIDFTALQKNYLESPILKRVEVTGSITLIDCRISGSIIGYKMNDIQMEAVHFQKNFTLIDCQIEGNVNIREAIFMGNVSCSKSGFKQQVSFEGSMFHAGVNFSGCQFLKEARFHNSFFNWKTNFMDAGFSECGFQGATFNGDAQFSSIRCIGYADFSLLNFHSGAFFNYANFDGKSTFGGTSFKGRCDFNNATFLKEGSFKDAVFYGNTRFNNISLSSAINMNSTTFFYGSPQLSFTAENMSQMFSMENARIVDFKLPTNKQ